MKEWLMMQGRKKLTGKNKPPNPRMQPQQQDCRYFWLQEVSVLSLQCLNITGGCTGNATCVFCPTIDILELNM